jgi:pimeloyl-ACP methyl ester carboxylesterase
LAEESVILVHGIWMTGLDMSFLRKRLNHAGYNTHQFSYHSIRSTPPEIAIDLNKFANTINTSKIHYVCHSLGGLVIRHFYNEYPDQPQGRIVTLGTPHSPSSAAKKLTKYLPGRLLLGKSTRQGLLGPVPTWRSTHELGVIAGTLRMGVGMLIPGLPKPNDGTIAVEETKLEGMTDHLTLPVSHFGLLTSRRVAQQTIYFLNHGKFDN